MRIGQIEVEINIVFLAFGIMTKDWNLTFDIRLFQVDRLVILTLLELYSALFRKCADVNAFFLSNTIRDGRTALNGRLRTITDVESLT